MLLVEDNERLATLVLAALEREGETADGVAGMEEALAALATAAYDAVILDLGLADGDGLTLLRDLRRRANPVPVLIISARERLEDRLAGLNAGADDYLAKPFALAELVARLRALLRRPPQLAPTRFEAGNLAIDEVTQEVTVGGDRLDLPRRERGVLRLLLRQTGRLVPRSALENAVFGFDSAVGANALEVYIHRLRRRLAQAGASVLIRTEKGVGYVLDVRPGES
ncbi:response regulator [Phaeospirillum tilakii]|uniref:Response regulator n=1 Tax=Phaeospirillum tilakii TaxID=741673 RepID=A0ABW5C8T2_9PROT